MSAAMFGELLVGVLALCCLVFGCAMVRLLCMPVRRWRPRRSRLRRLTWRIRWLRLRRVRVPRDGKPLDDREMRGFIDAMRACAEPTDPRLAALEREAERELRDGETL